MTTEEKNIETLELAIAEALRFVQKANAAIDRLKTEDHCYQRKETAAVKRAALDLKHQLTTISQLKAF